jgi:hypothetical protein
MVHLHEARGSTQRLLQAIGNFRCAACPHEIRSARTWTAAG